MGTVREGAEPEAVERGRPRSGGLAVREAGPDPYAVQLYGPADAFTEEVLRRRGEVLRRFAGDADAGRAAVPESLL